MKETIPTKNNIYAKNVEGKEIHISEATSGRNGYFCLGCEAEMEARKSKKISSYFAHVPKDVNIERKCVYSDETYRHKLAKEILQRIKKVKVPPLYKYPPNHLKDRKPIKIQDSQFIEADSVMIERQFYEDETGEIQYGQNIDFEKKSNKYLLIQPDVVFFNNDKKPVLLIELVATHKIDEEKLAKIKRLGINTIQIRIPKESPQVIEETFSKTNKTEWIFNYEQENTNYISISDTNSKEIPSIDEFQKKLFRAEESFSCRKAEINNLIRGIRKGLESERFRESERNITEEIIRTERNTERNRERLRRLQEQYESEISKGFEPQMERFKTENRDFKKRRREHNREEANLEGRYNRKAEELETAIQNYRPKCQDEIIRIEKELELLGGNESNPDRKLEEIKERGKRIRNDTRRFQDGIEEVKGRRIRIKNILEQTEEKFERELRYSKRKIAEQLEQDRNKIRGEFKTRRDQVIKTIEEQVVAGSSNFDKRVIREIETMGLYLSIIEARKSIRTLEKAKELFDSRAWKNWD